MARKPDEPPKLEDLMIGPFFDEETHASFAKIAKTQPTHEMQQSIEDAARIFLYERRVALHDFPSQYAAELRSLASARRKAAFKGRAMSEVGRFAVVQHLTRIRKERSNPHQTNKKADLNTRLSTDNLFQGDGVWTPDSIGQIFLADDRLVEALESAAADFDAEKGRKRSELDGLIKALLGAAGLELKASWNDLAGRASGRQVTLVASVTREISTLSLPAFGLPDLKVALSKEAARRHIQRLAHSLK